MEKEFDIFEVNESRDTLHIGFSSHLESIDQVCNTVTCFLTSKPKKITCHLFAINLVLREGLTNAVRHGNQNNPAKLVKVQLKIDRGKALFIEISDQGEGFDWKAQKEIEMPDDEDHGRGIHIMETYFTRYSYNQKGNILYLEKTILP